MNQMSEPATAAAGDRIEHDLMPRRAARTGRHPAGHRRGHGAVPGGFAAAPGCGRPDADGRGGAAGRVPARHGGGTVTARCTRDHEVAPDSEQCYVSGEGLRDTLCCWLKDGHSDDHWDVADKIHWQQPEGLRYAIRDEVPGRRVMTGPRIILTNGLDDATVLPLDQAHLPIVTHPEEPGRVALGWCGARFVTLDLEGATSEWLDGLVRAVWEHRRRLYAAGHGPVSTL